MSRRRSVAIIYGRGGPTHPTPIAKKCQGGCGVYVTVKYAGDVAWCFECGKRKGKDRR